MTIEIKQVDIEFLAGIREAMGQKIIADELRAGRSDADNWPWKPLTVLATQRETYESRIAELERERDAADLSRTAYARALKKMRIALVNVHDGMEDEGDRIYLGSTNHAEDLKAAWHAADALQWEVVLADTQPKTDVVKANLHLQSEVSALTSANNDLLEALRPFMPITVNETQDYAELRFGEHQTQAMTVQPNDWLALASAYKKHGGNK